MASLITGRLPSPHDCIDVSVIYCGHGSTWYVRYTGTPKQLVAAGVIDSDMVSKIVSQKGGARIGKDGLPFKLRSGRVPAHFQWARDEAVTFERKVRDSDRHKLQQLPGMRELIPNDLPTQEERDAEIRANPGPGDRVCGSLSAQACAYAEAVGRVASRVRAIGRTQRLMRWATINDTVIAPDWAWLIKERMAGGAV